MAETTPEVQARPENRTDGFFVPQALINRFGIEDAMLMAAFYNNYPIQDEHKDDLINQGLLEKEYIGKSFLYVLSSEVYNILKAAISEEVSV